MQTLDIITCMASLGLGIIGCASEVETVGPGGGGGSGAGSDGGSLPCDVAEVLAQNCISCHSAPPTTGTPNSLMTYADLTATAPQGGTYAERALFRMTDPSVAPMPPLPATLVTPDAVATFEAWIAAGLPTGDCDGAGGAGPSPYDTPEVCTSDSQWTGGNHESPDMRPGGACNQCHTEMNEGPIFSIAGTVFPTAHEPDDCNGYDGGDGTIVEITDANLSVIQIPVRASGNFFYEGSVAMPAHARVVRGADARAMAGDVTDGDCNTCHTLEGSGTPQAPGRIMAP